jgi:hypothetical protein
VQALWQPGSSAIHPRLRIRPVPRIGVPRLGGSLRIHTAVCARPIVSTNDEETLELNDVGWTASRSMGRSHFHVNCRTVTLLAALAVIAVAAGGAATSSAVACGAYKHSAPVRLKPKHDRAPLVIGDSTMIFAAPYLSRRGFEADAKGCRQFGEGVGMLAARKRRHSLPRVAILALGANGPIARPTMARALHVMGRYRVLALVTARRSPVSDREMHRAARLHPDRVLLIDWVAYSVGHGGWFGGDGIHVNDSGARAFARYIRQSVVPLVAPPVSSLHMPSTTGGSTDCGTVQRFGRHLRVFVTRGEERIGCTRARQLARTPPLRRLPRWRAYDWSRTHNGPWREVYARQDRKVVIGTVAVRRPTAVVVVPRTESRLARSSAWTLGFTPRVAAAISVT